MLYVSIVVELLRSRPSLAVWFAALAQALLWTVVPTLFYASPPGDVPVVLAIGHEFQLGSYLGPPLAFWLGEIAFDLTGRHLVGVYALSQACVVLTYWAVFLLGRAVVGAQHAALAVLLMVGIAAFTVPTPDFGPAVLAMPLWAMILLHYWRAVGEGQRAYWLPLVIEIGLLLLTTYLGLLLLALLVAFTVANERARACLRSYDPLIAVLVVGVVIGPYVAWLIHSGIAPIRVADAVQATGLGGSLLAWTQRVGLILAAHAGLVVLVALVAGWPWPRYEPAPIIVRRPINPFARQFVYFFAVAPPFLGSLFAVTLGWTGPMGGIAPLVVLSGLAVIVAVGDAIPLTRQHIVIAAWFGLLLVPPVMAACSVFVLPWLNIDLRVAQPFESMGRFFSENFERRTIAPLRIVGGDLRIAALVALGAPSRPSLFIHASSNRSPWITIDKLRSQGAVLVWPTADTAGTAPQGMTERFPQLVAEVPRGFERRVQGRLPPVRIGWAVIRPRTDEPMLLPGSANANP
jgi:4-amino-4-deoxy-L-arabinose transferase-like glycosyltransferase